MVQLPKIIVIVGPTAVGKTDLSLELAKKFNGEIINADSRQVYQGMDIGTAKEKRDSEEKGGKKKQDLYLVKGIPHHLMDVVKPNQEFTLADFKEKAGKAIADILKRDKLPIIVGGTGLYVRAIIDNLDIPAVAPNFDLRKKLEEMTLEQKVDYLKKIDPKACKEIDLKNPRRVIRAIEVVEATGKSFAEQQTKSKPLFDVLQIGLNLPRQELNQRIDQRVDKQIKDGLVDEVKKLAEKYDWKLPAMSGIGYKQIGFYLRQEIFLPEAIEMIKKDTRHYAKRQMTWFNKDERIKWVKDVKEAEDLLRKFLN